MPKKIFYFIIPLTMLACNFLFPQSGPDNTSPQTPPEVAPVEGATPAPEYYSTDTFTITRVNVQNGELLVQLATETQKAKSLGQMPFIEFDATWCPPCITIDNNIKAKEPLTTKAFEGVYLIRADVDEWGWGDGKAFNFEAIPIYYELNDDGTPSGSVIDGGAWNEDIPENFAPVLDQFFHTP